MFYNILFLLNCKPGLDINIHKCFYMTYFSMAVVEHLRLCLIFCYYKNPWITFPFKKALNLSLIIFLDQIPIFIISRLKGIQIWGLLRQSIYCPSERFTNLYHDYWYVWAKVSLEVPRKYVCAQLWLHCKFWILEIMFSMWLA